MSFPGHCSLVWEGLAPCLQLEMTRKPHVLRFSDRNVRQQTCVCVCAHTCVMLQGCEHILVESHTELLCCTWFKSDALEDECGDGHTHKHHKM